MPIIVLTYCTAAHSLQGALGKTSGRSYKAAPRQLLQVDSANGTTSPAMGYAHISKEDAIRQGGEGAAKEAAKLGAEALGGAADVGFDLSEASCTTAYAYTLRLSAGGHRAKGTSDIKRDAVYP